MSEAMKAYHVSIDKCGWDECDAFVVVAADEYDARAVVAERFAPNSGYDHKRQREAFAASAVVEVDLTVRGEVLGSFNAG